MGAKYHSLTSSYQLNSEYNQVHSGMSYFWIAVVFLPPLPYTSFLTAFNSGCFDICGSGIALPSNPLNLSNIPVPLPRGMPGWRFSMCQYDFKNTSETCVSRGYGRQEPMSFLAGCKKE